MTRLTWEPITLHFRTPFRVSYGTSETRRAHWLRLADDEGWGEGTIPPYYGISDASMAAVWDAAVREGGAHRRDPAVLGDAESEHGHSSVFVDDGEEWVIAVAGCEE